jgi:hypothetical protein
MSCCSRVFFGTNRMFRCCTAVQIASASLLSVHAHFRLPISGVPFFLNFLSRNGSLGCSLCSVHEARDFPQYPTSFAEKGRSRLLARIDGLHDRGDWKANETREIAAE